LRKQTDSPKKTSIYIKLASLLTLLPIIIVLLYYIIPSEYETYIRDLSGNWKINEGYNGKWNGRDFDDKSWREIKLPGRFHKQGYKNKIYLIRKNFTLKEKMLDKDLFLMFGKTRAGVGRVYINGRQVGEIGIYRLKKNTTSGIRGLNGFTIFKEYFKKGKNVIAIHLHWVEISPYNGINDQRFYIGVNECLKKYFLKNTFIYKFFQYGLIFFSIFVIGLMFILLISEWKSGDRYKYISTSLFVLSSILYNLTSSGSFIELDLSYFLMNKLHAAFIPYLCFAIMEFMQYYLLKRITLFGKINRVISALAVVMIIFTENLFFLEKTNSFFTNYFILVIFYLIFISLREVFFRKKNKICYYLS